MGTFCLIFRGVFSFSGLFCRKKCGFWKSTILTRFVSNESKTQNTQRRLRGTRNKIFLKCQKFCRKMNKNHFSLTGAENEDGNATEHSLTRVREDIFSNFDSAHIE